MPTRYYPLIRRDRRVNIWLSLWNLIGALTPIFVTLLMLAILAGLLAAAFATARKLSRFPGRETFDVGGRPFDKFYIRAATRRRPDAYDGPEERRPSKPAGR